MTFQRQDRIVQEPQIEELVITLRRSTDQHDQPDYAATYAIAVTDQNSFPMAQFEGNLIPHLTQPQIDQLLAFMETIWTKAEGEVLPED